MIDPELAARLDEISVKVSEAYHAAESTRKYLFWTGVITAILVIIPLVGLFFVIPQFLSAYSLPLGTMGLY